MNSVHPFAVFVFNIDFIFYEFFSPSNDADDDFILYVCVFVCVCQDFCNNLVHLVMETTRWKHGKS